MVSRLKAATLVAVTATALLTGAVTGVAAQITGPDGATHQADWRWDSPAPVIGNGADS
ncbi:hypothetical protein ACE1OC_23895 [Streptomyces sp. DSM 116496]|uniref:hypothetical protein n=1 Tax=Streptomyces stoeckheimensis TaxID=3344656 RepID=UPI0038B3F17A